MAITAHDERYKKILHWIQEALHFDVDQLIPASSDASFRRYFRVTHGKQSFIIMDAPPEKENTAAFIQVAELFKQAHVQVPTIIAQELEQGFLLLDDFGSECLLDVLTPQSVERLYATALSDLVRLQSNINPNTVDLPHYTPTLLHSELDLFSDWFLQQQQQLILSTQQKTVLNDCYQLLINSACQQTQVCVHRDYHSRNLMYINETNLGMIDFQDAVVGPITYDAVSLLRDCYIAWPEASIEQHLQAYYQQLQQAKILHRVTYPQFKRDFDFMGIQRHLKAIGIFSRLNIRDNKSGYLADIPRTLNYVLSVSQHYPELQSFHDFLQENKALLQVNS